MAQDRIVVRGLNWLGDGIMALPALQRLREARPDAYIALLTPAKLADLWRPPLIDAVIPFENDESLHSIARKLRAGRFSTGIVLPMSFRSALELWLAGIPVRIGTEHKRREIFLTQTVRKPVGILEMKKRTVKEIQREIAAVASPPSGRPPLQSHHIYRYLNLVAALGADPTPTPPCLPITHTEVKAIRERFFPGRPLSAPGWLGMSPGAEYGATKRWPEERFVEAACRLYRQTGYEWLLFGGPGDRAACERIETAIRAQVGDNAARSLAGQTSLWELAGLLHACAAAMGNDSGPMHLAAAVSTPVSVVFGSTSAVLTGQGLPGSADHSLLTSTALCSPCFLRTCPIDLRCMDSLTVERMIQGVLTLLPEQG